MNIPNIIMYQPNFSVMGRALQSGAWDDVVQQLLASIQILERAGADFAIIPANTVHKEIGAIQKQSPILVLNMLEVVAAFCQQKKLKKIGVMGTVWTMSGHLYRDILASHTIEEVIPAEEEQQIIQRAIFSEIIPTGKATDATRSLLLQIVQSLAKRGCDGIALACTELPLVLNEENCTIPVIDTTAVLADAALKRASQVL